MEDTSLGKDWRVVQKFEHRHIYDVAENDDPSHHDDIRTIIVLIVSML
jgi:hypothetical protein